MVFTISFRVENGWFISENEVDFDLRAIKFYEFELHTFTYNYKFGVIDFLRSSVHILRLKASASIS